MPWHGPGQLCFKLNFEKGRLKEYFTLDKNLLLGLIAKENECFEKMPRMSHSPMPMEHPQDTGSQVGTRK